MVKGKKRVFALITAGALVLCTLLFTAAYDNTEREFIGKGSYSSYRVSRADVTVTPQDIVFVNDKGLNTYAFRLSFSFTKPAADLYAKITDVTLSGVEYSSLAWISENGSTPVTPYECVAGAEDGVPIQYLWTAEVTFGSDAPLQKALTMTVKLMSGKSYETAKESTITVPLTLTVADKLSLQNAIAAAGSILNPEYYTEESLGALNTAVGKAQAVLDNIDNASEQDIRTAAEGVYDAIGLLAYKPADYTWLNSVIDSIPDDLSGYTDESVQALNDAITAVDYNLNITRQGDVDYAAQNILLLIDALTVKS